MKKWERRRRDMRIAAVAVGAAATSIAGAAEFPGKWAVAMVLAVGAAWIDGYTRDMQRDPWTTEEIEAHRAKRRRTTTRSNPLMLLGLFR